MPVEYVAGGAAEPLSARGIGKQRHQFSTCLGRVLRLHEGAGIQERAGDIGKVRHRRTNDDRAGIARGLEDVVAARRHEASADEDDRRVCTERREFADRVEHEDIEGPSRVRVQRRPAHHTQAGPLRERGHAIEALGMSRRKHQPRIRGALAQVAEGVEKDLVLALQRARRE